MSFCQNASSPQMGAVESMSCVKDLSGHYIHVAETLRARRTCVILDEVRLHKEKSSSAYS